MTTEEMKSHTLATGPCPQCWGFDGPKKCENCGGRVHSQFGDYTSLDSYYLERLCEKCGDEYEVDDD